MINVISLGAGVQSTAMAMMAAYGELTPMPDAAIFADTGAEPAYVYETVAELVDLLPFPVHVVKNGDGLKASILRSTTPNDDGTFVGKFAGAPFFNDRAGMLRRQCTREFKIEPVNKKVRDLAGLKPRQRSPKDADGNPIIMATLWVGISWDERQRMKYAREPWLEHRWPLIEKELTRGHCIDWLRRHNLPIPQKSACTFCPYRDNAGWREMKAKHPEAWAEAVEVDEAIRSRVRNMDEQLYVHVSRTPLATADLSDATEGQLSFLDECDGMCGV